MTEISTTDPVDVVILELLRCGVALSDLAADLIDCVPQDAYPGEDVGEVVVEMITGSARTYLCDAADADIRRASELIAAACDRVIEHLKLALDIRRREDAWRGGEDAKVEPRCRV